MGHASFKIRGKNVTIVTDPFNSQTAGLKFPKTEADIVTVSHNHDDHNQTAEIAGEKEPFVIRGPGEYEIKGVKILGVASFHDKNEGKERGNNTIYKIRLEGVSLVHCGDLGHKLDSLSVEALNGVDVLFIPVGGFYTIDAHTAGEVVSQLEPKIIIPMHYNRPGLNQEIFGKLEPVERFLKEMGKENIAPVQKLVVVKEKLPLERQIVVL